LGRFFSGLTGFDTAAAIRRPHYPFRYWLSASRRRCVEPTREDSLSRHCANIASANDAWERICAGASLVQLYSAMVYEGPRIAARIARGLAERLQRAGYSNIAEAVGTE